jgi:hypothetical protein
MVRPSGETATSPMSATLRKKVSGPPRFLVKAGRVPSFASNVPAQGVVCIRAGPTRSKFPGLTETLLKIYNNFMTSLSCQDYPPYQMKG